MTNKVRMELVNDRMEFDNIPAMDPHLFDIILSTTGIVIARVIRHTMYLEPRMFSTVFF